MNHVSRMGDGMGSFSVWHWLVVLIVVGIPLWLVVSLVKSSSGEVANTWKFRTVILVILAFVVPLWPVTLPLFLFLAYRSYKAGSEPQPQLVPAIASGTAERNSAGKAQEIAALHELVAKGALTQAEFDAEKQKILGAQRTHG